MNWETVLAPMAQLEDGVVRPLNSQARRLLGAEPQRIEALIPNREHAPWTRLLERVRRSGFALWFDTTTMRDADIGDRDLRIGVSPSDHTGFVLTFVDRTAERRRAGERQRSNRFLTDLLDQTPTVFFVVDRSGRLVFRNAAFDALVRERVEVVSRASLPQLTGAFHDRLTQMFETGSEQALRTDGTDSAGRGRHFQLTLQPLQDRHSLVHQALIIGVDLTELIDAHAKQRRLQAELEQAQRLEALGQMAGTIAHDFNNFLSVMFMAAASIREAAPEEDSEMTESIDILEQGCRQARDLTQDLVAFSRTQMHSERSSLLYAVLDAIAVAVPRLVPPAILLHFERPPVGEPTGDRVPLSESQCLQIVMNLVQNAINALDGKGQISTTLIVADASLQIRIEDDGPGVPAAVQRQIFEPFFTMRESDGGTGLGLTSARTLVERAGGTLVLQTAQLGGAAFVVTLPLITAAAAGSGTGTTGPR